MAVVKSKKVKGAVIPEASILSLIHSVRAATSSSSDLDSVHLESAP